MIPTELTIQGLYSYQKRQTIDFTQLTADGLFGIFGTVGSGKSTILEAITFAIYGRTDRLNQSGDNRYYNMMNLKSDELLIDFKFEADKEKTPYRSIVKGKRNSKRFEDVKTLERSAYKKIKNEWVPIENIALEKAIGLSYDNFRRTIIIPQGQFQEFLQLGNRDRTQMMKELFNLGKFEFYYKVVSLETKNNAQKQNLEGQLQQLGAPEPEQVNLYQEQLSQLQKNIREQNIKLVEYQKNEEQLRNLQELMLKRAKAEKELKNLLEQEATFVELEKKISRYEQCVIRFKHLLDSLKESKEKEEKRKEVIRADNEKFKSENAKIDQWEKLLEKIKPAFEKREELKRKAEELTRLLQIKTLENTTAEETLSVRKGTGFWNDAFQSVENLKKEKVRLEAVLKELRDRMPDLALLSDIKTWYVEKHYLNRQLSDIEKNIQRYNRQEKEIIDEKSRILTDPLFKNLSSDPGITIEIDVSEKATINKEDNVIRETGTIKKISYDECNQYLESESERIKKKQRELNEYESHILVKARLKAYAEDLEENKPCPLCGSLHHPELFKSEDIREELENIQTTKRDIEKQLDHITSLGTQMGLLETRQHETAQHIAELGETKNLIQQRTTAHIRQFVWEKYDKEDELNSAFAEAKQIQEEIEKQERTLQYNAKEQDKQEHNRERAREKLERLKNSLTIHQTKLNTLRQQLQIIHPEQYTGTPVTSIEDEKSQLLKEYDRLKTEYNKGNELLQEQKKQKEMLKGRLETNRIEWEKERRAIETLEHTLETELEKSTFLTREEVTDILSESIDTDTEKQKVTQFKNQLLQSKSSLERCQNEIGEREYKRENHQKLVGELNVLKDQITRKNMEQGKITGQLQKLQKDLESQASLRKELEVLEIRAENIRTMKSLFKASGFVNYISSVYLQNLCNAANDRFFQLTRQKLSLEITVDNNFQIRDFMNGGKVRSVKTLSGGQTFQASLSLALALADNIQKITQSNQNFFFLDEGFGSLDKESLDIVFDTLKSLRKENRIVGVISHVEEMQQEIEVHLRIENNEECGSIVHRSWEE